MESNVGLLIGIVVLVLVVILFFYFVPVGLWVTAIFSGSRVVLSQSHPDQRAKPDPSAREDRGDPQPHRNEVEKEDNDQDQYHDPDQQTDIGFHAVSLT